MIKGEPPPNCRQCPRLVEFRTANRKAHPGWFNAPVPSFGPEGCRFLVVGLAPGLRGANRTGRPFTGDAAGDVLYPALVAFGFAEGSYRADPDDGLQLKDCMITNAVRCVPPGNKPNGAEIRTCRQFLSARLAALPRLSAVLALGRIAHDSLVAAYGGKQAAFPFSHGNSHDMADQIRLFDSYHCSRYNLNTGRLTVSMLHDVLKEIRGFLDSQR